MSVVATLAYPAAAGIADSEATAPLGEVLRAWSTLPFAGMLLSIALFPLVAPRFWHRHYPKISLAWGLILAIPLVAVYGGAAWKALLEVAISDYVPFIVLLWGLFTVSGGIVVRGTPAATPAVNTCLLLAGTIAASWIGTTGAAMLLIRPLLRANAGRRRAEHVVVFFIFLVANVGGCLTPLGDPPLFLGFLHGVPFFWTLHLVPEMIVISTAILAIFYLLDRHRFRAEAASGPVPPTRDGPLGTIHVAGLRNLLFAAGIVAAVLLSGLWTPGRVEVLGIHLEGGDVVREVLILAMGLLSLATTPREIRTENGFSWGPMREVAILFAAVFVTIVPAIAILRAGDRGQLSFLIRSIREPWQYFWATGLISSFLDNAPTYLTLLNVEIGRVYAGVPEAVAVARLVGERHEVLRAISAGAVFMGALTYIGNAPNFMVRSIAEEAGVEMPSFVGYVVRWSLPFLIPVFLITGMIFF